MNSLHKMEKSSWSKPSEQDKIINTEVNTNISEIIFEQRHILEEREDYKSALR